MSYVLPNVQVEDLITGSSEVSYRASVRLASGNANWTGTATAAFSTPTLTVSALTAGTAAPLVDGVEVAVGDRILIKDNVSDSDVPAGLWGIWTVITAPSTSSMTLERAEDMVSGTSAATVHVVVREGTGFANSGWIQTNNVTINDAAALSWKLNTTGTGTLAGVLPITSGGTGAASFTDQQLVKYDAGVGTLVSTTTARIDTILDVANSNAVVVDINGVASAVNNLTVTNAATGGAPTIAAVGTDTNINLSLQAKGTGAVDILGTAASAGTLRLFEDTDNGTNSISIRAPAALTASYAITMPTDDGASGQFLVTDGTGNLSWATSARFLPLTVASIQIAASATAATAVAYVAWDQSAYGTGGARAISTTAASSKVRLYVVIAGRDLTISAGHTTTTDVLAAQTITTTGAYEYDLAGLPTADSRIAFYVNKSATGGTNPQIFGITADFALA